MRNCFFPDYDTEFFFSKKKQKRNFFWMNLQIISKPRKKELVVCNFCLQQTKEKKKLCNFYNNAEISKPKKID